MPVSLDDLNRAAKTVSGTVNDAYLTAVTGGLRRYHEGLCPVIGPETQHVPSA